MAGLGVLQANQQRKAAQKQNEQQANMSAAQMEYSPWTGVTPSTPQMTAVPGGGAEVMGAAQGALSGYMMNKANPNMFGGGKETPTKVAAASDAAPGEPMEFGNYSGMDELQKKYGIKR